MYKGKITSATTVTASTNIPFTTDLNTNGNTSYDETTNALKITNAGYYDVNANLVVTNVAIGNITAQLYANGVAIPEAIASATSTATTDLITLTITDIVKVVNTLPTSIANLSLRTSVSCTVNAGIFEVERRK